MATATACTATTNVPHAIAIYVLSWCVADFSIHRPRNRIERRHSISTNLASAATPNVISCNLTTIKMCSYGSIVPSIYLLLVAISARTLPFSVLRECDAVLYYSQTKSKMHFVLDHLLEQTATNGHDYSVFSHRARVIWQFHPNTQHRLQSSMRV